MLQCVSINRIEKKNETGLGKNILSLSKVRIQLKNQHHIPLRIKTNSLNFSKTLDFIDSDDIGHSDIILFEALTR